MSSDLLENLEEDEFGTYISLEMNHHGSAFLSVDNLDDNHDMRSKYIFRANEEGIKNAKQVVEALKNWIEHIKATNGSEKEGGKSQG